MINPNELKYLDPVFAFNNIKVYTREYINELREQNISTDEQMRNIIPQEGFQEDVCVNNADVLFIGGKRGGGKTAVMEIAALRDIDNPLYTFHGFRKEEKDIKRGLWNTSQKLYQGLGIDKESSFTWEFPSGAKSIFEHLQNENEIDRRFRGVEMPFIIIDEVTQISFKTFFTLLASNRNSIGVKNQFICALNPVGEKHWIYHFLSWYIDPISKTIIPERNNTIRYFYKYGEGINEIAWGDSKDEVYSKAKDYIDQVFDKSLLEQGLSKYDLINSLCFIEGHYSQNKIFIKKDKSYLGNLAQQGGRQSIKDINGIWEDIDDSEDIFTEGDFDCIYDNVSQTDGNRTGVADIALSRDGLTLGAFDGNHLYDIEMYTNIGSIEAIKIVKTFLHKHNIPLRNFAFDSDGVGAFLKEPLKADRGGAFAFHNNSKSSDSGIWYNLKAECAESFAQRIREKGFSIDSSIIDKKLGGKTLREHLDEQRKCIRRKETNNGKFQLIGKPEMKKILGGKRSPDIIEMIIMHEHFNLTKKKGNYTNLNLLNNL